MSLSDLSIDEVAAVKHEFNTKAKEEGSEALSKAAFKSLVKYLMKGEMKSPSDKDLDSAFVIADEDKGGTVDLNEFLNLYKLIKRGEVVGLGKKSLFGSGKREKSFKQSLKATAADVAAYTTEEEEAVGAEPNIGKGAHLSELYEVGAEVLGTGAYATVFRGTKRATGEQVAVKTLPKSALQSHEKQGVAHERAALEKLKGKHSGVLQLADYFDDSEAFHLVTEVVEGGRTFRHVIDENRQRQQQKGALCLTEAEARRVAFELASTLSALHDQHLLVHFDVKPENVMIRPTPSPPSPPPSSLVLIDFGLAAPLAEDGSGFVAAAAGAAPSSSLAMRGTPAYASPEMLAMGGHHPGGAALVGAKCDVWSLGVVCYEALCGHRPPPPTEPPTEGNRSPGHASLFSRHDGHADDDQHVWDFVSWEAKDALALMLTADHVKRPTMTALLNTHPWFQPLPLSSPTQQPPVPNNNGGGGGGGSSSGGDSSATTVDNHHHHHHPMGLNLKLNLELSLTRLRLLIAEQRCSTAHSLAQLTASSTTGSSNPRDGSGEKVADAGDALEALMAVDADNGATAHALREATTTPTAETAATGVSGSKGGEGAAFSHFTAALVRACANQDSATSANEEGAFVNPRGAPSRLAHEVGRASLSVAQLEAALAAASEKFEAEHRKHQASAKALETMLASTSSSSSSSPSSSGISSNKSKPSATGAAASAVVSSRYVKACALRSKHADEWALLKAGLEDDLHAAKVGLGKALRKEQKSRHPRQESARSVGDGSGDEEDEEEEKEGELSRKEDGNSNKSEEATEKMEKSPPPPLPLIDAVEFENLVAAHQKRQLQLDNLWAAALDDDDDDDDDDGEALEAVGEAEKDEAAAAVSTALSLPEEALREVEELRAKIGDLLAKSADSATTGGSSSSSSSSNKGGGTADDDELLLSELVAHCERAETDAAFSASAGSVLFATLERARTKLKRRSRKVQLQCGEAGLVAAEALALTASYRLRVDAEHARRLDEVVAYHEQSRAWQSELAALLQQFEASRNADLFYTSSSSSPSLSLPSLPSPAAAAVGAVKGVTNPAAPPPHHFGRIPTGIRRASNSLPPPSPSKEGRQGEGGDGDKWWTVLRSEQTALLRGVEAAVGYARRADASKVREAKLRQAADERCGVLERQATESEAAAAAAAAEAAAAGGGESAEAGVGKLGRGLGLSKEGEAATAATTTANAEARAEAITVALASLSPSSSSSSSDSFPAHPPPADPSSPIPSAALMKSPTARLAQKLGAEVEELKSAKRTLERHILTLSNENQRLTNELKQATTTKEVSLPPSPSGNSSSGPGSNGDGTSGETTDQEKNQGKPVRPSFFGETFDGIFG